MSFGVAFQRLLQSLAIVGILFAPVAAAAHGGMGDVAAMAMQDGMAMPDATASGNQSSPCCPGQSSNDCLKCAITAPCMAMCLLVLAVETTFPGFGYPGVATQFRPLVHAVAGLVHAPPLKPPRS